jgi:hypothetical protein
MLSSSLMRRTGITTLISGLAVRLFRLQPAGGSFAEILGSSGFIGSHARELGTGTATGKRRWTGSRSRAQEIRKRRTLKRRRVPQRKKIVFEWEVMEITCCVCSSAIYVTFRTFSSDNFQAAIRKTSSLRFTYAVPTWMPYGHERPARWRAISGKEST